MPAYITPPLHGLDKAFVDSRLLYSYFPSTNEIFSSVGIIAFVILMFSVAWEWLPILERNNHPNQGRRSNDYGINPKGTTHKA